jgi:uncharacterized protein
MALRIGEETMRTIERAKPLGAVTIILLALSPSPVAHASGAPSFDCSGVEKGSIAERVCKDPALAAADRKLDGVYRQAAAKAKNEQPPMLAAEQRGWIKGRDDCWKADDVGACIASAYTGRIAELQARYRLVPALGPFRWTCDNDPANEVVTTFFETEPATMIAERGDETSLMTAERAASGARYVGRNESYWEHQGQATIVWGYQTKEVTCRQAK